MSLKWVLEWTSKQLRIKELTEEWLSERKVMEAVAEEFWSCSSETVHKVKKKMREYASWEIQSSTIDEKITRKEEDGIHEVKYEWDQIITRGEFIKKINFDEDSNEVISYQCNLRPVVVRVSRNETKLINKYEHFIRSKPITGFNLDAALSLVEKRLSNIHRKAIEFKTKNSGKLLEICLFDAHLNKRSYDWNDWSLEKACEEYTRMIASMIARAVKIDQYERCLLIIWNDFFNSDAHSRTTSWTPQDNTSSEEQSFAAWLELLTTCIELCNDFLHCPVDVVSIPGNHARLLETVLGTSLKCIYRNNNNIIVDDSLLPRKYYQWWNTSIMFSHGDWCKKDKLPMLFANERPDIWAATKYRQCHLWHIHSKTVDEINWVIIRHLSSITSTDAWHMWAWYVWNRRWWQMFIFDREVWEEWEFNFYV